MTIWTHWATRSAQTLALSTAAVASLGEASARYDAARHGRYARHNLRQRQQEQQQQLQQGEDQPNEAADNAPAAAQASWLQRERPRFPYVLASSPGDSRASAMQAVIGGTAGVIGSVEQASDTTLDELVMPSAPVDRLIRRVAMRWNTLKSLLDAGVPLAFDPKLRLLEQKLEIVLEALEAVQLKTSTGGQDQGDHDALEGEGDAEQAVDSAATTTPVAGDAAAPPLIWFLRDFDHWDEEVTQRYLQWVHHVTSQGLAHVVLATTRPITPTTLQEWQRLYKAPNADFVAILLRLSAASADGDRMSNEANEAALRELSQLYGLQLTGLEWAGEEAADTGDDDADEREPSRDLSEAQVVKELVGDWWDDVERVCRALQRRGLGQIEDSNERLALIRAVCDEVEDEMVRHVLDVLELEDDSLVQSGNLDAEQQERALSALQAWKCVEVVTDTGETAQVLGSPQDLLKQKDGESTTPPLCTTPVQALMPFNQRTHGEAKFFHLIDHGLISLRPKNAMDVSVVPCEMTSLVAPCWVETRPLVKRAFQTIWRKDEYYLRMLKLERVADNHKLREEIELYEQEIEERRVQLDMLTRKFIVQKATLQQAELAQREAELALIQVEIESKQVYLERLQSLLD